MEKLNVGDRVWAYYCPDLELLASRDAMDENTDQERMTSFQEMSGIVVDPNDEQFEMEGDYEWELCVAFDDEQTDGPRARTFRAADKPGRWSEGPYYGGYSAEAVIVKA